MLETSIVAIKLRRASTWWIEAYLGEEKEKVIPLFLKAWELGPQKDKYLRSLLISRLFAVALGGEAASTPPLDATPMGIFEMLIRDVGPARKPSKKGLNNN